MAIIEAKKTPLGEWAILRLLVRPALRRMFSPVWMAVDPATAAALCGPPPAERPPVIWASPHPSWWDGYLGWLVNWRLGNREGYLMMDAEFLPRYRFFTWGGVFGVDRHDPRAALESVEYIARLLGGAPNRALWMFPQGEITPPDRRPLHLYGGITHILRRLPAATVVPVAWRPVFREEQRPEVLIRVGTPLHFTVDRVPPSRDLTAQLTDRITALDDAIRAALIANDLTGYRPILRGGKGINRRWDDLRGAARQMWHALRP
jgi:1-acyl-sn-glycerol-3-phosphate acyltransferase